MTQTEYTMLCKNENADEVRDEAKYRVHIYIMYVYKLR